MKKESAKGCELLIIEILHKIRDIRKILKRGENEKQKV